MFFLFFCVLCGDHVTFDISLYGYEFITFKFTINLYYILGMMKKIQRELLLLLVQPYNSIGDVDAYAINLDIDHEETSYAHDTDRSSSITDSKGGIPSLREPFSSKLFIE
jgi:hypothetical protein